MLRESYTPLSILIGSAIIGSGLYFGLRERGEVVLPGRPATTSSAPVVVVSAAPPREPPLPTEAAPVVSADVELRPRVVADATAALAAKRPHLLGTCWAPALAKEPLPAAARYLFDMTFDAEGVEISRGISEIRGASRSDVAQCLRQQPMDLRVAPPGVNVRVEIPVDFP